MNYNFYLPIGVVVVLILCIVPSLWFSRRLATKVKGDESFPKVKEMLAGKITRQSLKEVKDKLLQEGLEQKRVSTLISAAVYAKQGIFSPVILLLISFIILIRAYTFPSTIGLTGIFIVLAVIAWVFYDFVQRRKS